MVQPDQQRRPGGVPGPGAEEPGGAEAPGPDGRDGPAPAHAALQQGQPGADAGDHPGAPGARQGPIRGGPVHGRGAPAARSRAGGVAECAASPLEWGKSKCQRGGSPTTGLRERGNDTSKSTGRSGRQKAATRRNMRREERVTVQGPVKEQQPDGMSHGGGARSHVSNQPTPSAGALLSGLSHTPFPRGGSLGLPIERLSEPFSTKPPLKHRWWTNI